MLSDGYIVISASIAGIKPYGSGSEITLEIVNWMGVTLTGVELRVAVSNKKEGTPHIAKDTSSIQELGPGKGRYATIRVPQKPEEFDAVGVIFLGADGINYSVPKK